MATVDVRYEGFPLETDASALAIDAHAWLKDRWPDYVPSPADFDSGTIDAHARMIAELRDIAAAVPDDIFRRVAVIAGIDPIAAAPATLTATATAIDTLGYVIPAGTVFGLRATGDTLYTFAADDDVRISAGTTVSPVFTLTATEDGIGPNGLGGLAVSLVAAADRTLPWLDSAQTASVVIGGADEETISDFLTRAARSFRRRSPRLILPEDFAADALDDPAVARAYSLDRYLPGTNERQTLGPHDSTSGTFTITWNGQTTGAVPWNSTAGNIQANLVALSNIADGDVIVTGADGLDPGVSARQRIEAHQNAQREAGFLARVRAPAYDDVSVTATAKAYPGWDPVDVQARAVAAVQTFLSPAQYGIPAPSFGDPIEGAPWYQDSIIRLTELIAVLEGVDGLWRVTGPGANGLPHINGSAANYTLVGLAYQPVVMPTPGAVTITVTA
jgi:hypothetical protein